MDGLQRDIFERAVVSPLKSKTASPKVKIFIAFKDITDLPRAMSETS